MTVAIASIIGLLFLGMGVYALLQPRALTQPFDIQLPTPEARAEVRAVYGGFGVAVAVVLGLSAVDAWSLGRGALVTVALSLFGMAAGRFVSGLIEAPRAFYPIWFYCLVELVGGAALLFAAL